MSNKILTVAKAAQRALSAHSPAILTGIGVAGVITTPVLAVRATPEALRKIEAAKIAKAEREATEYDQVKLTNLEIFQLVWQDYAPAALSATGAALCIIGSNRISSRRSAMAMSMVSVLESGITEYKNKTIEELGPEADQKVVDAIAKDKVAANPLNEADIEALFGKGSVITMDGITGQYFLSDMQTVKAAVNEINHQINQEMSGSQNEFLALIGAREVEYGDEVGWTDEHRLDIQFTSEISDGLNGKPVLVLSYRNAPIKGVYRNGTFR